MCSLCIKLEISRLPFLCSQHARRTIHQTDSGRIYFTRMIRVVILVIIKYVIITARHEDVQRQCCPKSYLKGWKLHK